MAVSGCRADPVTHFWQTVQVDASEGVLAQTETVLRQAIRERVRIVLFINKVDRLISELQLTAKAAAERIMATVEAVNGFVATFAPHHAAELGVSFEAGTVAVGSGYFGWGFTVDTLALLYERAGRMTATEVRAKFQGRRRSPEKRYKHTLKHLVKLGMQVRARVCDGVGWGASTVGA